MMKAYLFNFLLSLPFLSFAQFPPPENFSYSYDYIMIDQIGECAGELLQGPTYCSHFTWYTPDTLGLSTTLEYYHIYVRDLDTHDINIIATSPDTSFHIEMGIIGDIWVTAVYSNPDGESEPSNIETNYDLPIFIEKFTDSQITINYDRSHGILKINRSELINHINIYSISGILKKTINDNANEINISDLNSGLYIIEIFSDQNIYRKKLMK